MKKLIKKLIGYFVMFIIVAGVMGYFVYSNRYKKLPLEGFLEDKITKKVMPELYAVTDTMITPEQILINDINRKNQKLDLQQAQLNEERLKYTGVRDSVSLLRDRVNQLETEKGQQVSTKIAKLAKIYQGMKPAEVAPILEELDNTTIISILENMRDTQIAQILENMDRDRAVEISRAMTSVK
ncbi:MotE family protein [candidate division KSB1 bacterium]